MIALLRRLRRDRSGSTIIEFALLAPVILGLMVGGIQVNIAMQNYNALRAVASDTARYAVVQYMKDTATSTTLADLDDAGQKAAIEAQARTIATSAPYLLLNSGFSVTATSVATPQVTGTIEKTLTVSYTPPDLMPFYNITPGTLTFSRPIILIDE